MSKWRLWSLGLAGIGIVIASIGLLVDGFPYFRQALLAGSIFGAIGMGAFQATKGYQYTMWIIVAVVAGMTFPDRILHIGEFDMRNKWLILVVIQLVMFGMGIQMKVQDFTRIGASGKGVAIGLATQFTIMPLVGFLLTRVFDFEPEIAAGVILIGSCSSGLASNVMAYIAKANLVLSVTVTAFTTILAPIMTPFMMKVYAGTMVEVSFLEMAMEIIKIMIVPIGAGLLHDYLKTAPLSMYQSTKKSAIVILLILLTVGYFWDYLSTVFPSTGMIIIEALCFMLGAIPVGFGYHLLTKKLPSLDKRMPYFSMFGIVYFTAVTTAAGQQYLMEIGAVLFLAAVIHNGAGYFFGYWFSKLFGLNEYSARAMALEVGLQNGGMASGLAGSMGKLGTVGLAAAVFSPWMNISGSILANYWRRKQEKEDRLKNLVKEDRVNYKKINEEHG
ncbi:bile acid:sodium symporter family protein [Sphingobacterium chuzhouense]|uniref:Bile acid:sodium symporter family protein n=1 Tax=Sphingobacterium chuzhouense TaxID=1742264 RepID=A0ABR7XMX8_9SPHI|nr:bile acid:sodium symporter family protein [Sphingobacterium chuzhouense]MBD1420533.1 bile acid:sodium symporter family protein [Sphingobacterium chuzhouense]